MVGWTKQARKAAEQARKTPEVRAKMSSSQKGRKFTEEHKMKLRKPKMIKSPAEYSRIRSMASKKNWQDPEYRNKVQKMFQPSKLELSLVPRMESLGYWHSGGGDFFIIGKDRVRNPDFKKHGENKIVEVFGSYWHQNDRGLENDIIAWYREAGYACVIVWEDEVEQLEVLVEA